MARRKPREGVWEAGQVLLLDPSAGYLGVFSGKNSLSCTLTYTLLYVYYTLGIKFFKH